MAKQGDPKTDTYPPTQQQQVPVENLSAGSRTVMAICLAVATFAIGWVTLKADLGANQKDLAALRVTVNEIKVDLKAFDRLSSMQAEINDIKKNGSDALTVVRSEVDRLREAFRVHVAKTTKDTDPMP